MTRASRVGVCLLLGGCVTEGTLGPGAPVHTPLVVEPAEGVAFDLVPDALGTGDVIGWGMAVRDFDGDGLVDVYVNNHASFPSLYRADGTGGFVEVTGLLDDASRADSHGVAWADIDGDGFADLTETVGRMASDAAPHRVWLQRDGAFVSSALDLGLAQPGARGRTMTFWDADNDGLLDVIIGNDERPDGQHSTAFFRQTDSGAFELGAVQPETDKHAFHTLLDGDGDGFVELVEWRFGWGGVFDPLSGDAALDAIDTGAGIGQVVHATVLDADGVGAPEILLTRGAAPVDVDIWRPSDDELWAGFLPAGSVMGIDAEAGETITVRAWNGRDDTVWDLGGETWVGVEQKLSASEVVQGVPELPVDGSVHVAVGHSEGMWHIRVADTGWVPMTVAINADDGVVGATSVVGATEVEPPTARLLRRAGGMWLDVTEARGLQPTPGCEGVGARDFDNDGDVDLLFACARHTHELPDELWLNDGHGSFKRAATDVGHAEGLHGRGRELVTGDFDGNGFVDALVMTGGTSAPHGNGPYRALLGQPNGNHWLTVDPVGTISNRDAIGARVEATVAGRTMTRWVTGGTGGALQSDRRLHFGLGGHDEVERLVVWWPSGLVTERFDVAADQVLVVEE